jgi:hypothetical protein
LEQQEAAMRVEWERRVMHGEEVDQWRNAEEQRLAQLRYTQEQQSNELAREMDAIAQVRRYWEEQHSQLEAQRAELARREAERQQHWQQEEAERRQRWEQEEAERRRRWEQEDRLRMQRAQEEEMRRASQPPPPLHQGVQQQQQLPIEFSMSLRIRCCAVGTTTDPPIGLLAAPPMVQHMSAASLTSFGPAQRGYEQYQPPVPPTPVAPQPYVLGRCIAENTYCTFDSNHHVVCMCMCVLKCTTSILSACA